MVLRSKNSKKAGYCCMAYFYNAKRNMIFIKIKAIFHGNICPVFCGAINELNGTNII